MKRVAIRCSALPHVFACNGSLGVSGIDVSARHPASEDGSAGHDAMTRIVAGHDPDIEVIAALWAADRDEVARIVRYGRRAWQRMRDSFPSPLSEVVVGATIRSPGGGREVELTGHVDLLHVGETTANLADWKSGRVDRDYFHQVAGYASCVFKMYRSLREVFVSVIWLRDEETETYRLTRAQITEWEDRLLAATANTTDFRTGEQCTFCPKSHACPALVAAARRDVAVFGGGSLDRVIERGLADLTADEVIDLRRRLKVVDALSASASAAIRRRVAGEPDRRLEGTDTVLRLVDERGRRNIDPMLAGPVLNEAFTWEELHGIIQIRATAMDELVAAKAGKGRGAAAKRELAERLQQVGAVTTDTVTKLKEERKP